uniref:High potential iron-sulfur protein n=1 Tax=Podoviridae sp. ctaNW81 TaxID=2826562 RepID=A0A8S5M5F3_9CAUD|nr:MAG TPA: High potential iron-sulfur protein [Podoviridae sp. ctaNW81]
MLRLCLLNTTCINCKYYVEECTKHTSCFDCPISTDGYCLCLQQATQAEILNLKCKYFTEKE